MAPRLIPVPILQRPLGSLKCRIGVLRNGGVVWATALVILAVPAGHVVQLVNRRRLP